MNILIIKLAAIGDVLRTTSILLPLKKKYPKSRISWVTERLGKEMLLNNPYLESVYSLEEFKYHEDLNFDVTLSLDENEKAAQLATDIGGNLIGFYMHEGKVCPTPSAQEWFDMSALGEKPLNNILKKRNEKTYQEHLLEIIGLSCEGAPSEEYPLVFNLTAKERMIKQQFKKNHGINPEDIVIGFNTGAGGRWQYKKWNTDRMCRLISKTSQIPGVKLVLLGGPEEKERNEYIMQQVGDSIIDTGTGNSLRDFGGLIDSCDILVTSDSLSMHLGVALGKYVIVFFGPTSHAEIELYGSGEKIVPQMDCLVCYKQTCNFKPTCMDAITVNMMSDAVSRGVEMLKGNLVLQS